MDEELRRELCDVCHQLYDRGYVVSNDGNVSARTPRGTVLITPSGVGKGRMEPDMLVETDLDGRILSGDRHPSSEGKLHWMVYRERSDVMAVVHAHPPMATAFSVCRRSLTAPYLTELVSGLGEVPLAPFAMPSTDQVPESVRPLVRDHRAALLSNHGALAWGPSLLSAFDRLETVEQTAKIFYYAEQLGGGVPLTAQQVQALRDKAGLYAALAQTRTDKEEQQ